jgi:hypothetical protein
VGTWNADDVHQLAYQGANYVSNTAEAAADYLNTWGDNPSNVTGQTSGAVGVVVAPTDAKGTTITYVGGEQIVLDARGKVISKNY